MKFLILMFLFLMVSCAESNKIAMFKVDDCFEGSNNIMTTNPNGLKNRMLIDKITAINTHNRTYDIDIYWLNTHNQYEILRSVGYFKNDLLRKKNKTECPKQNEIQANNS